MPKSKQINVALLGCGKLGEGIYKMLLETQDKIISKSGVAINVKYILVRNKSHKRARFIPRDILTDDPEEILQDDTVKIFIDAIGGIEPTFGLVRRFLDRGMHMVSANRALLASKMRLIFELAKARKVFLRFDAAIGAGLSITRMIRRDLIAAQITSLWGIVSGSSNFILSEMTRSGRSVEQIVRDPSVQNLAESHMIIDYEGSDAAQKLALLAAVAFGVDVNYMHVHAEGIGGVSNFDLRCADEYGYCFKLLAILRERKSGLELRVHPTLVPIGHPLTSVQNDYNAFFIATTQGSEYMLYGRGSGVEPTAAVIVRDLVDIAWSLRSLSRYIYEYPVWSNKPVLPIEDIVTGYYVRFPCYDMPGVIGKIASVLGDHNININSAHASVDKNSSDGTTGYVHIFVDSACEKDILGSIEDVNKLQLVRDKIVYFRIIKEAIHGKNNS
jgi:homoserine dehydrogenase